MPSEQTGKDALRECCINGGITAAMALAGERGGSLVFVAPPARSRCGCGSCGITALIVRTASGVLVIRATLGRGKGSIQSTLPGVMQRPLSFLIRSGQQDLPPRRVEHPAPPHEPHCFLQQAAPSASVTPLTHQLGVAAGSQHGACLSREHCGADFQIAFPQH